MSGNISCRQCGNQLSTQDIYCGQCGMPRDRGSDATIRSTNSQAPTEPGTSFRMQNLHQRTEKARREGVGNQLLHLWRFIFRRQQAQAQPTPGRAQVLPPPSYVLWAKRILIVCTLLALLPALYEYLQVRNSLASTTGTAFLTWSFPILGIGWMFLGYTVLSWTKCLMKGHNPLKSGRKSIHELGVLAIGSGGVVLGHLPFLFVLLNIRGVVSSGFMLMSFAVAVISLPLCAIALRFVKEEKEKKTATEVPWRLWLQYLLPVIGFYCFSYQWAYRMTEDWPLALIVALGLALLGIGFVLWAWPRLYSEHKKLALVAMVMYILGIGGEVTLLVALRDSSSDVLMLGAIVVFIVLIGAGVVLIPVRTWKSQFLQGQLQQQNRTGVRRLR
jgi:ribosomal protein L37E